MSNILQSSNEEMTTSSVVTTYQLRLKDAKQTLRLTLNQTYDDDYINRLIQAAYGECEDFISKDIALTTNTTQIWDFSGDYIRLPKGNYNNVVSITDTDSNTYTMDTTTLRVYDDYFEFYLTSSVPTTDPLTVVYQTGYTDDDTFPENIKRALEIKVKTYYDVEVDNYSNLKSTDAAERLLRPYMASQMY